MLSERAPYKKLNQNMLLHLLLQSLINYFKSLNLHKCIVEAFPSWITSKYLFPPWVILVQWILVNVALNTVSDVSFDALCISSLLWEPECVFCRYSSDLHLNMIPLQNVISPLMSFWERNAIIISHLHRSSWIQSRRLFCVSQCELVYWPGMRDTTD